MLIEIDFNSDEAIYVQLQHQIIMGIATETIREGDSLPSVRQLADMVGINMHTVNKAYSILKQQGFIRLDRRKGAVIAIDADKLQAYEEMRRELRLILAKGCCKDISREEVHELVDELFEEYAPRRWNNLRKTRYLIQEERNRIYELYRTGEGCHTDCGKYCKKTASSICWDRASPSGTL